jgi:phosphopantothenoylcysteine decarboxylase/phosphopantothenate--cysteine ligase
MDFAGKTVAIAITGGIAAYKACDLIRELYRRNVGRVLCIMTPAAEAFITPLTLQALSRYPVYSSAMAVDHGGVPIHIVIAQQADALVVLPATADTISKMAQGGADNLVTTSVVTFTDKPVLVVPAMNTRMWNHPLTRQNLQRLQALPDYTIVEPIAGSLACGETGDGHIAEQEIVLQALYRAIHPQQGLFEGVRAVVTAGGTSEPIDPVRVISNHSSGKMGLALADELAGMGAFVTLISTRLSTQPPLSRAYEVISAKTAEDIRQMLNERFDRTDLLFMTAAIADYTPSHPSSHKIKREQQPNTTLAMTANPDILAELGKRKRADQWLVGFAAESEDLLTHAADKLRRKNLDAIAVNDISRADIGFESEQNEMTLLFNDNASVFLEKAAKDQIARKLLLAVHERLIVPKARLKLVRTES